MGASITLGTPYRSLGCKSVADTTLSYEDSIVIVGVSGTSSADVIHTGIGYKVYVSAMPDAPQSIRRCIR